MILNKFQVVTNKSVYKFDSLCKASAKSYALDKLNISNSIFEFKKNAWYRIS